MNDTPAGYALAFRDDNSFQRLSEFVRSLQPANRFVETDAVLKGDVDGLSMFPCRMWALARLVSSRLRIL